MSDRYFVETPIKQGSAVLTGAEAHHLSHVLRARAGDAVTLFDGSGAEFSARVERVGRSEVELSIVERREVDREAPRAIVLAVALPKGDRQRWLVEKAVELGVAELVPLVTERGVARAEAGAVERLRRTVIEASKQCGRNKLMAIAAPRPWQEHAREAEGLVRLVAHPRQSSGAEWSRVLANAATVCLPRHVAIGPEGGFTENEIDAAVAAGWQAVDLGPRILRVETAATLLVAILQAADR